MRKEEKREARCVIMPIKEKTQNLKYLIQKVETTMTATWMNNHADYLGSNDMLKRMYYGVRKCDSLQGPAIFLNWTDCEFFVGSEKDDNIEYQSFERIVDAMSYVTFQPAVANHKPPVIAPPEKSGVASLRISLKRSVEQAALPSHAGGSSKKRLHDIPTLDAAPSSISKDIDCSSVTGVFERNFERLKKYKHVHGTVSSVPFDDGCDERFRGLHRFLCDWTIHVCDIKAGRIKPTSTSFAQIKKLIDLGVDLGLSPRVPTFAEKNRYAFERRFQMLKEYQETYGTNVLIEENWKGNNFKRIKSFIYDWRSKQKNRENYKQTSATVSRILRLECLGFLGDQQEELQKRQSQAKRSVTRPSLAFERDFLLLKEYKDMFGSTVLKVQHCKGNFKQLMTCIYNQRAVQTKHRTVPQSNAAQSRIRRMVALGFLTGEDNSSFSTLIEDQHHQLKNLGFSKDLFLGLSEQPLDEEIHDRESSVEEDCDNSQHTIKSDEPEDSSIESEDVIPATLCPSFLTDISRVLDNVLL